MEYKILEKNGIENENVDGAEFNNFCAGDRDGIVEGVLNECKVILPSSNSIEISTGEIIIKGFRLKITSPYNYSFVANAGVDTKYHIVAVLNLNANRDVSINILCKTETPLIKDDIFKNEFGVYELEIVKFTHTKNGIENVVEMLDIINGGGGGGFDIGNVETEILNAGETPQVDVKNVSRDGKTVTDFKFSIPKSYALGETSETAFAGDRGKAVEEQTKSHLETLQAIDKILTTQVLDVLPNKVDKIVPDGNFGYVYAQQATGKETKIRYQTSLGINSSTIPLYRLRSEYPAWGTTEYTPTLISGMPENNYEVTPKKYVEDRLSGKLDKVTTIQIVYGTNAKGEAFNWGFDSLASPNKIVFRNTQGKAQISTPTAEDSALAITNRAYVDAQKVYEHNLYIGTNSLGPIINRITFYSTNSNIVENYEDIPKNQVFAYMEVELYFVIFDSNNTDIHMYRANPNEDGSQIYYQKFNASEFTWIEDYVFEV